jgi:MFS family permease
MLTGTVDVYLCFHCISHIYYLPFSFQLYHYYGFRESDIAVLYVAGFAASVLFGTATGPLADLIGRRKIAQLFCVMYTFCW